MSIVHEGQEWLTDQLANVEEVKTHQPVTKKKEAAEATITKLMTQFSSILL